MARNIRSRIPWWLAIIFVLGFLTGTYLSSKMEVLVECFLQISRLHGPFVAFSVILVFVFIGLFVWLIKQTIKPRDDEIERVVEERNKLQDIILKSRLSSKPRRKK